MRRNRDGTRPPMRARGGPRFQTRTHIRSFYREMRPYLHGSQGRFDSSARRVWISANAAPPMPVPDMIHRRFYLSDTGSRRKYPVSGRGFAGLGRRRLAFVRSLGVLKIDPIFRHAHASDPIGNIEIVVAIAQYYGRNPRSRTNTDNNHPVIGCQVGRS